MRSRDKALLLALILFYVVFFPTMSCHVISCHITSCMQVTLHENQYTLFEKHPILRIAMSEIL